MLNARVDGVVVSTVCHPSMRGRRMIICQPLDAEGRDDGPPVLAFDPQGSGMHERVLLSTDGAFTRQFIGDPHTPMRNIIIGEIDPLP